MSEAKSDKLFKRAVLAALVFNMVGLATLGVAYNKQSNDLKGYQRQEAGDTNDHMARLLIHFDEQEKRMQSTEIIVASLEKTTKDLRSRMDAVEDTQGLERERVTLIDGALRELIKRLSR